MRKRISSSRAGSWPTRYASSALNAATALSPPPPISPRPTRPSSVSTSTIVRTKRPQWQPLAWRSGASSGTVTGVARTAVIFIGACGRIVPRGLRGNAAATGVAVCGGPGGGLSSPPMSLADRDEREPTPRRDAATRPRRPAGLERGRAPGPAALLVRNALKVIGPGAIMAATSIGGGEWLVGPAAAVKYSSADLPDRDGRHRAAGDLQPRGDPLHALHRRADLRPASCASRPGRASGPASTRCSASSSSAGPRSRAARRPRCSAPGSGACRARRTRRRRRWIASALILAVVAILSFGGTIERMLEYFAWTMLGVVFLFLLVVNVAFVPAAHWRRDLRGLLPASPGCRSPIDWGAASARSPRRRARAASATSRSPTGSATRASAWAPRWAPSRAPSAATQITLSPVGTRVPGHGREPRPLARVAALRARRPDLGVGPLLLRRACS